ncbi:peptidoglycan-binding protein [Marinobacterium sp. YM272]|uniref:peptidoglycan-binding protein n=1 Tax=Marinobacterium sp. YM272 TaxID=3421654 RepID=UPI003D7FE855
MNKSFFVYPVFIATVLSGCTQIGLINSSAPTRALAESAKQGDAESQYQLGLRFTNGADVLQDYALGVMHFKDAARQGHTDAQYMLGMAYYLGRGTNIDYDDARFWLEKAASAYHREAMHYLGEIYFNGYGTEKAPAWGVQWAGQAAERGYAESQYLMGVSLLSGIGSSRNQPLGQRWLRSAHQNGSLRARELMKKLNISSTGVTVQGSNLSDSALRNKYRIRYAQTRLNQLGYPAGAEDGLWGGKTEKAARQFMNAGDISLDSLVDALRQKAEKH